MIPDNTVSTWILSGQLHLLANLSDRNGAVTKNDLHNQVDDGLLRHLQHKPYNCKR